MTCAACANRIEKDLTKLDGVDSANVNFALEKASRELNRRSQHQLKPRIHKEIRQIDPGCEEKMTDHAPQKRK